MRIIIVDDEKSAIKVLTDTLKQINNDYDVVSFESGNDALEYAKNNKVDVAFLDIEMPEIKGVQLADKLLNVKPDLNIIFSTGYDNYSLDAMKLHASGYILKPILKEDVQKELSNLRYPVNKQKRIYIQTKGNFDVKVDGKIVNFTRSPSKEMLAYLVDRKGSTVTRKEACLVLFPNSEYNRNKQMYMSQIIASLETTLEEYHIASLIIKEYNSYKVDMNIFDSDIDDIKENDEYMSQFSWGKKNC